MGVRFTSTREAIAFINWLYLQGITRRNIAAAIESDFEAAQVFFGLTLLEFRAEKDRRVAVSELLEGLESEESS